MAYAKRDAGGCLYRITNMINGKTYYGITSLIPETLRWRQHCNCARGKSQALLYRAIRKYGKEMFFYKIVERHETDAGLRSAEMRYIAALRPSYNMTEGGTGAIGRSLSSESLRKMSDATKRRIAEHGHPRTGMRHTEESRARMSASRRANPQKYWLGKTRPAETVAKISATKKGNSPSPSAQSLAALWANARKRHEALKKPIRCLWDGREFESGRDAARYYGLDRTAPNKVANGKVRQVRGLTFEWMSNDK